jgi:uncharacterized protein
MPDRKRKTNLNIPIPGTTRLGLNDKLPLSCSRGGICCHGKTVGLNPWELARLAKANGLKPGIFRDRYCMSGGIRLRFDQTTGWDGLTECSQYVPDFGCSIHECRPLVCRLYPIGRLQCRNDIHYIHLGNSFPCLEKCPEVLDLPYMSVGEYLDGQNVKAYEVAQDKYLELMQRLADNAFVLLFETGLAVSGDKLTLRLWRELGKIDPEHMSAKIGQRWIDLLMIPDIKGCLDDPSAFANRHIEILDTQAQESFGNLNDFDSIRAASSLMMSLALHLGRGLGVDPTELAQHWILTAKKLGAKH